MSGYYGKRQYSRSQQQAYHSGMGYSVGYMGIKIEFSKPELHDAFAEGFRRGVQMQKHSPKKYPPLPKPKRTTRKKKTTLR